MTGDGDGGVKERVTALEERVAAVADRDLPLLTGAVRALSDADIDSIEELPAASRAFHDEFESLSDRVTALEERVAALGDIGTEPTTKDEKYAAVLSFAANKRDDGTGTVAVTSAEVRGCTGVSRRYAYDLVEAMATDVDGVRVREPTQVRTGSGTEHKSKALLVDCEQVHATGDGVNQFTTGAESGGEK